MDETANKTAINENNLLNQLFKKAFTRMINCGLIVDIETGFKKLDLIQILKNGHLTILASRPEMGKEVLATSLCHEILQKDQRIAFFSLRSTNQDISLKIMARETAQSCWNLQKNIIVSDGWVNLTNHAVKLVEKFLYVNDYVYGIEKITEETILLRDVYGIHMIIIDELPLMQIDQMHDCRYSELTEITRLLKILAKKLNIPILLLTNASRSVEERLDHRPILSDLRESGLADEIADTVLFLYRDIVYNPDYENPALAELIVAKNDGPTGTVYLHFDPQIPSFCEIEQD